MEILKPGQRHLRNPPFAPLSSEHKLRTGRLITFVFSLARGIAISLQEQRTILYCPVLPTEPVRPQKRPIHTTCGLFLLVIRKQSASSASFFFKCSIHVTYRIFLEPLRTNILRANTSEALNPRIIPLPR